jgi:peptidyl-dipeptidase Dcp
MAKTPENVFSLLDNVWTHSVNAVNNEIKEMELLAGHKIEAHDYSYYSNKLFESKYLLDNIEIMKYFQLNNMKQALFYVANRLFNINFTKIEDVDVWHSDVETYLVSRDDNNIGIIYFDFFARENKTSGAWMSSLRSQSCKNNIDIIPLVTCNTNFIKSDNVCLLSFDDATTLFHEFGHVLHGLLSNVKYPSISGTSTLKDYVEFPSQFMENYLFTSEVLNKFAIHCETNESISEELVSKIKNSLTHGKGYATLEYVMCAIADLSYHLLNDKITTKDFLTYMKLKYNGPDQVLMRHGFQHFLHIFQSEGYASAYYCYIWADVLASDAFEKFRDDPFNKEFSNKLEKYVYSAGNSIDPEYGFKMFKGADPDIIPLMKSRGFVKESLNL